MLISVQVVIAKMFLITFRSSLIPVAKFSTDTPQKGSIRYLAYSPTNEPMHRLQEKQEGLVQASANDLDICGSRTAMRSFSIPKLTRPSIANVAWLSKRMPNR